VSLAVSARVGQVFDNGARAFISKPRISSFEWMRESGQVKRTVAAGYLYCGGNRLKPWQPLSATWWIEHRIFNRYIVKNILEAQGLYRSLSDLSYKKRILDTNIF
jgi:hypothetical protein